MLRNKLELRARFAETGQKQPETASCDQEDRLNILIACLLEAMNDCKLLGNVTETAETRPQELCPKNGTISPDNVELTRIAYETFRSKGKGWNITLLNGCPNAVRLAHSTKLAAQRDAPHLPDRTHAVKIHTC